ncbi:MAG TPA: DUF3500 domain-containing protein, partial [Longimicrobiales bacterium]|nr:DUF3500 domain-containing protein [Longimicrobiales bacterium]
SRLPSARIRLMSIQVRVALCLGAAVLLAAGTVSQQQQQNPLEPFKGVTSDGNLVPGLFAIRATGVSTQPMRGAAERFLAGLTAEQRSKTAFAVDDGEWRLWNNVHRYARQGVSFREMSEDQRERAFGLLRASLSAKGLEKSRNVMRLNGHLAELRNNFDEYGEDLYYLTVMGNPSDSEPWGWQLDGHHLIVNYFVLGDQVVMTPTFMGSEPVRATSGKYAGTAVMQEEQNKAEALMASLTAEQRQRAVIRAPKTANVPLAHAFRDNVVIGYAGIPARELNAAQQQLLLDLVAEYVNNLDDGHARVRMEEVKQHLNDTHFAWIGDTGPDAVFYYRIQSPVILIEFDHQSPVALPGPRVPGRAHVHTVVRTPNGNDYGKDLLRQHYEAHKNDPAHGHRH